MTQIPEIYVSTDVEMDGPIPGKYSMLSLGAAAFSHDKKLIDTFTVNFELLPGAITDPEIMQWWDTQPAAWHACRLDPQPPEAAMREFARWIEKLPGAPIFVAYPVGSDFLFVQWYFHTFIGSSPFGYRALDVRSYAMAALKKPYGDSGKSQMPKSWLDSKPHTHVALDDAIAQGHLFCNMLNAHLSGDN